MKNPDQRVLDNHAAALDQLAKLLRKPGSRAIRLAEQWSGVLAATPADSGPRSTELNDLSRKVAERTPEFVNVHDRIITNLKVLAVVLPVLVTDLTFCQEVERVRRLETNRLDRLNSRTGYCEIHYEATANGWCQGTLERIVLETSTVIDGQSEHEQIDVCRSCAVSGHSSRGTAKKAGERWDVDAWRIERMNRIRADYEDTRTVADA